MIVSVHCMNEKLALQVLSQAVADLQSMPAAGTSVASPTASVRPVDEGASCELHLDGDELLEELFLRFVYKHVREAGLPSAAVTDQGSLLEHTRSDPAWRELPWPDGSSGMTLSVGQIEALPVLPEDELYTYEISSDSVLAEFDLPPRAQARKRVPLLLDWLTNQQASDVRIEETAQEPSRAPWHWQATFRMSPATTGTLRLVKEPFAQPRLTLQLATANHRPSATRTQGCRGLRLPPFDVTAPGYSEVRQRFDLLALRQGWLWRTHSDDSVSERAAQLRHFDYRVHEWDAQEWATPQDMRTALIESFVGRAPDEPGSSELSRWLRDLALFAIGPSISSFLSTGTVLVVRGFRSFEQRSPEGAAEFLDAVTVAARIATTAAHPLVALYATSQPTDDLLGEFSRLPRYHEVLI